MAADAPAVASEPPAAGDPSPARWHQWACAAAALAITALFIAGAATSIVGALPLQRHQASRDYVENVQAALELSPDLVLYDTAVPPDVLIALLGDQPMASRTLLGLRMRVDQPAEDLRMLDSTGTPRRIGLVNGISGKQGPIDGCGYPLGTQPTRVGLTQRAEGKRLVAQIGYYAQQPSNGTMSTPQQRFAVRFEAGLHHVSFVVDGPFAELLLQADGAVCVTDVLVGTPLPHPN